MLQNKTFLLAGGDARYLRLAGLLSGQNRVYTMGLLPEEEPPADPITYLILPMAVGNGDPLPTPLTGRRLSVRDLLPFCDAETHLLGGGLSPALKAALDRQGLSFTDYQDREELAVGNAVPTAEGAIGIAMAELPYTVAGLPILILGYGRIGRVLADRLIGLGGRVTVAARSETARVWAGLAGCETAPMTDLPDVLPGKLLVVNTVPALLLTEQLLQRADPACLLLDLASRPGGIDFAAADRLGLRAVQALSLPGKVAPATAAALLYDTIGQIDRERRELHAAH